MRFFLVLLLLASSLVWAEGVSNTFKIDTYTFYYLSPDSTPERFFKVLIVGQTADGKLKILYEGRELKLVLPGIAFPEEAGESIWGMRKLLADRLLLGEEVYLSFPKSMRDDAGNLTPLLWVKFNDNLFLFQSLLLSNGLVRFDETICPEGYRGFLKAAETFAKNNELGIWVSDNEGIKRVKVLGFNNDVGAAATEGSLGDLLIVEISRLYETGKGTIVIESRADGVELSGVRLAILSDADGSEEDSFIFEKRRVLNSGERVVIAVALDRSMVKVKNYDYVWETTIDSERGKLKIAYPDGDYDVFEYRFNRKLDGCEITPIVK